MKRGYIGLFGGLSPKGGEHLLLAGHQASACREPHSVVCIARVKFNYENVSTKFGSNRLHKLRPSSRSC